MPDLQSYAYKSFKATFDTADEGRISAVVSTFDQVDSDGDVCLGSFWKQGEKLPMVWSHDWDRPIGVGTIDVHADKAVFNGELFLDTIDGREAYTKMRRMADIQEFSFGYRVTDAERGMKDGQPVRYLKAGERFEVSPVLVGANRSTRLLSLKGQRPAKGYFAGIEAPEGSYEDFCADIAEAFHAGGYCAADCNVSTVATFPNGTAYVCVSDPQFMEPTYWRVQYDGDPTGEPTLTGITQVEANIAFAPADEQDSGISYAGQAERALAAVRGLTARTRSLAELRRKEGRTFSSANVSKLTDHVQSLRDAADQIEGMVNDAQPKPPEAAGKGLSPELLEAIRLAEIAIDERQMALNMTEFQA